MMTLRALIIAPISLTCALHSYADNQVTSSANPSINVTSNAPLGVPQQFNIAPTPEILDAVKEAMGGVSVEDAAQADNAVRMYDHAKQQQHEVTPIIDTFPVKLHSGIRYTINVVSGFESELAFFDLNGQPWEVGSTSTGNTGLLSATKNEIIPHTINIAAAEGRYAGRTNLKVRFKGLETSVSFPININTQTYHETLKVVLPGSSPNAKANPYSGFGNRDAMDDVVARSILDNPINPETSVSCEKRLAVAKTITGQTLLGIQPVIFSCETGLYIRSRYLTGPSPDPNGFVNGPDGYRVDRFIDAGEYFSYRDKSGQPVFIEAVKPQKMIGARFGDQVRLSK